MAKKTVTTPKGTARYPWLNVADSKFGDPTYKCDLIVDEADAEDFCADLEDRLNTFFDEVVEKESGEKYAEIYKDELPFFEEDGKVLFRTKLNQFGENKKTQETWENFITFYDAKGKPIAKGQAPKIGGGSVLRISVEPRLWTMPETEGRGKAKVTNLKVGIKLNIKAVQIIEARQGGNGPASAAEHGFGEEEGYSYDPDAFDAEEPNGDESDDF